MDIGIVGSADRVVQRLRQWKCVDGVTVAGIATTNGRTLDTDVPVYDAHGKLLDDGLGAIDCVTSPASSQSVVLSVIESGTATLVPWPPAETVSEADIVASAAEAAGAPVVAALLPRFDPARQRAKARIDDDVIGAVGNVRVSRRVVEGDDLVHTMALELDFVRWVCGDIARVFTQRADGVEAAIVTGRCTDGTIFHIDVRRDEHSDTLAFEFAGDEGLIEYDSCKSVGVSGTTGPISPGETAPTHRLLTHFRDCVAGTTTPVVDTSDSVVALRIADALAQSIESGSPVTTNEQLNG